MTRMVEGYLGGRLVIDEDDHITAFFCERFVTGCPCDVPMGAIGDDLLALAAGDRLERAIPDMDVIYACRAPATLELAYPETVLYFLSSYRHGTNMIIVSQEKLSQAICRAIVAV